MPEGEENAKGILKSGSEQARGGIKSVDFGGFSITHIDRECGAVLEDEEDIGSPPPINGEL